MQIGEFTNRKILQDAAVQVCRETKHSGCQHEIEYSDKEIHAKCEIADVGVMAEEMKWRQPSHHLQSGQTKNTIFEDKKPVVLKLKSDLIVSEPPKLAPPKKKAIFKAENSIDLTIFSNMNHKDSLILQTKYRKEADEQDSYRLDQTILSESDNDIDLSFSAYSFENKASRFRNSRLFRKLNDLELKNLHIHSVFRNHTPDKNKQYVSSKRMNKIALHVFHCILINNDMTDVMTMIYEYFAGKTKRDAHAIAMLKAVYAYCQVRESGNRTKIDILIKFVPFKMINMINIFKEILRGLFHSLDE